MRSSTSASSSSSGSRVVSSATMTPSPLATAQPCLPVRSTRTSSGPSSCAPTRKRPPSSSSNSPASSAARTAPSSLPSLGPSTGKFGFTRSSVASTGPNSTSLTRSSSRTSAACSSDNRAPSTTSRRRGCRTFRRADWRAVCPSRTTRRTSATSRSSTSSRSRSSGQPSRWTDGAAPTARFRHRWSAKNGITGATTRIDCTSACQSVRRATSSPSQNRRRERVAPGAVHLPAFDVEQLLVGEHLAVWGLSGERNRHEHQRVEPEPDLLAHLRDPVRRKPVLPVGVVGQIGAGQVTGGAGGVAALDPRVVLPAKRREGDDSCVEPDVSNLGHPLDRLAARLTANEDPVDPGPVELLELLDPLDRACLQLLRGADHVQLAARARIEGQRQAVEAAARDVPVAHVPEPVVHPLAVLRRRPLDSGVRVQERLPDLVDADEPVVGHAPDERRVAAPAMRVAVLVEARADQEAPFAKVAGDLIGSVAGRGAVQPAVVLVEAPRLVDRGQHRQALAPAEIEVLLTRAGRDVDDARAFLERDLVPGDDPVLDSFRRRKVVVGPPVAPADELGASENLLEGVVGVAGDRDPFAVLPAAVPCVRVDRRGDVGGQRPGRRRPDDEVLVGAIEQR